jgi:hypothetical protein
MAYPQVAIKPCAARIVYHVLRFPLELKFGSVKRFIPVSIQSTEFATMRG